MIDDDISKPDPKEIYRCLRWMCEYNKWLIILNSYPETIDGHITGNFECSISIETSVGVVFRQYYVSATKDRSENDCVSYSMKKIFDCVFYLLHLTRFGSPAPGFFYKSLKYRLDLLKPIMNSIKQEP